MKYLHTVKYRATQSVSDTKTTRSGVVTRLLPLLCRALPLIVTIIFAAPVARAQGVPDTAVKTQPTQPATPPTGTPGVPGLRIRLGRDTLPLRLPTVQSRTDRESYRQAAAQIEAARATAFQQNMRAILESVWGQVATTTFATSQPSPGYPGELPPKPKPPVPAKPVPIIGE